MSPLSSLPRFSLPSCIIAFIALLSCSSAVRAAARPPNIIFILIDDLGWKDVGCNGSRFYETPNIDALARRGMRFTNAYAACPVCSPTRVSILSGKYPARLNLTDWLPGRPDNNSQKLLRPKIIDHMPLEENNLGKALKAAGYRTASIGKWHLGGGEFLPEKQGFDLNVAGTHAGSPPGGYFHFHTPTLNLPAKDDNEYLTDRLTDEAEKFIEASKAGPFFLYFPHYAVHIPLMAKQKLIAHFQDKANANPADPQNNAIYAAMIQSVDDSVGRIVRKLDELHLTDNTLIIFTSDNGGLAIKEGPHTPSTSNAPLRGGKGDLYDGGIREPLIVTYPGVVRAGSTCDTPIESTDYYLTLLDFAGAHPQPGQIVDGVNLMPLLRETGEFKRAPLFWHYPHYANQGFHPGGAVRQGDWKLIQYYEEMHVDLFNIANDISEKENLAEKMPEKAAELKKLLEDWRVSVDARMPTINPNYGKPTTKPATKPAARAGRLQARSDWDID
jgi:arylsulfatase A-like enzyme